MGKKKHAEHVNHERWLVSYADLLTLLFAFFVVLFASSVSDKKKTAAMAAAMQTAFNENGIFDAHAKTPPLEEGAGNSQGVPAPLMMPVPTAAEVEAEVKRAVSKAAGQDPLRGSVQVHGSPDGTVISLSDAGIFASGSADLSPGARPLLRKLAATLPDGDIRVEGHTDNLPMHSERFHSNFELSTARASAVMQALLQESRILPSHFALAGYGEFRPAASNATAEGRAQNRRVDIVLARHASVAAPETVARQQTLRAQAVHTGKLADKGPMTPTTGPMVPPVDVFKAEETVPKRKTLAQQLAPPADRDVAR